MGGGPHKEHVLVALPFPKEPPALEPLRKKFPDIEFTFRNVSYLKTQDNLEEKVPASIWKDVTILVTLSSFPKVSDAPHLDFIQLFSAGSNQIQKNPLYTDTDVKISTSSGIHGPQIAEWVIMTALVASHKYKTLYELQKQHAWGKTGMEDDYHNVEDMVGRRLGVLGYGSIGRQVARVGTAMGKEQHETSCTYSEN